MVSKASATDNNKFSKWDLTPAFLILKGRLGKADSAVAQHPFQPDSLPASCQECPDDCQPGKPQVPGWVNKPRSWDHGNTRTQHQTTSSRSNNILQICMTACRHCDCFPPIEGFLKMKQKDGTRGRLIWRLSAGLLPSLQGLDFRDERNTETASGWWTHNHRHVPSMHFIYLLWMPLPPSTFW